MWASAWARATRQHRKNHSTGAVLAEFRWHGGGLAGYSNGILSPMLVCDQQGQRK